jgi:hypothetical protein
VRRRRWRGGFLDPLEGFDGVAGGVVEIRGGGVVSSLLRWSGADRWRYYRLKLCRLVSRDAPIVQLASTLATNILACSELRRGL